MGEGTGQARIEHDLQAKLRSDPRERRRWLRFLDAVLADEMRQAGALTCEELIALAARPLRDRASPETIREWWEYASRRGWLEEHMADCFRLTPTAHADLRVRHERVSQPDTLEWGKALLKWTLPAGAIGAIGYFTGRAGWMAVAVLSLCLGLALLLLLGGWITRPLDRPTDRSAARRACAWLDGRRVPLTRRFRSEVRGPVTRLYGLSSQQPPPTSQGSSCR